MNNFAQFPISEWVNNVVQTSNEWIVLFNFEYVNNQWILICPIYKLNIFRMKKPIFWTGPK